MKTPKSQMIERLVRTRKIGLRIGKVTSLKTRQGRAPSISAASTSSRRDLRQAGVERDHDERQRAPHDQRGDDSELGERRGVPVVLPQAEDRVQHAVLEVGHPVPHLDGHDDRHRPDEHERSRQGDSHPRADADEQQREQRPDSHGQADVDRGEHDRSLERVPEDVIVEDEVVVVQADVLARVRDQLGQSVLLQREVDQVPDRVAEDGADRGQHGEDEQVGDGRTPDPGPGMTRPPSRAEARLGGDLRVCREGGHVPARLSPTKRSGSRRRCRLLPSQPA